MVAVDLTRLPKVEDDHQQELSELKPSNVGCPNDQATLMEKELIKADGNCLFNCASMALENTVSKPQ